MMSVRLAASLSVLAVLLALVATPTDATLTNIYFVHRHGARGGQGILDQGRVVSCSYPYCELTDNGKKMCLSVGKFIRSQYGQLMPPTNGYNVSAMKSMSTNVARVVISGEAVVIGMYNETSLPFVDYVPQDLDVQLTVWTSWSSWKAYQRKYTQPQPPMNQTWVTEQMGAAVLARIEQVLGLSWLNCQLNPFECVQIANDAVACNYSSGFPIDPMLFNSWRAMHVVNARYFSHILGYDPERYAFQKQVGSFGYPLAMDMINYFSETHPILTVRHTAAHDWTLFPLYTAIGIWTPEERDNPRFVPRFAETVILEKHVMEDGQTYLRCQWGYPEQAPPNFTMSTVSCGLRCINAETGVMYRSNETANGYGCLLADFNAYVQTTAPESNATTGACAVSLALLAENNCDTPDAPAPDSWCYFYRTHCPQVPCAGSLKLAADPAQGYACVVAVAAPRGEDVAQALIALAAPTLLAGAIAGFYGAGRLSWVKRRRAEAEAERSGLLERE